MKNTEVKNVLFIEAVNSSPHLETSMELVDFELKKGHKVDYFFIGYALTLPPDWGITMKRKWWNTYFLPENRAARFIRPTYFKNVKKISLEKRDITYINSLEITNDISALKSLCFEGIQIGHCIFGDYLGYKKGYSIDNFDDKAIVKKLITNAIQIVRFTNQLLSKKKYSKVYIFNGRNTFNAPIKRLCELHKIHYRIHERGSSKSKYFLEDYTPHNIGQVSQKIEKIKINSKIKEGHNYFINKRKGIESSWVSFKKTTNLDKIKLPTSNRLVVFYSSSEFEFEAVSDQNPRNMQFESQIVAIKKVFKLLDELDFQLVVRVHPNMSNSMELLNELREISLSNNVKIFWPDDEVDSYELLDLSSVVITYGSTMGAEALYWNKPCVLLQRAYYEKIDGLFIPENELQLKSIVRGLLDCTLEFKRNESQLLQFGYYNSNFGEPFKYYIPSSNGFHKGLFMGKNLQKSWLFEKISAIID
jgi:hypothetical protein